MQIWLQSPRESNEFGFVRCPLTAEIGVSLVVSHGGQLLEPVLQSGMNSMEAN